MSVASAPAAADLLGAWTVAASQTCTSPGGVTHCSVRGRVAVRNLGSAVAAASRVRFYLSSDATLDVGDLVLRERAVPKVRPGKERLKNLGTIALAPGTNATGKFVIVAVDATGVVAEANEANNLAASGPIVAAP